MKAIILSMASQYSFYLSELMRLIRLSLCATTQRPRQLTPADLSELETEFTKLKVKCAQFERNE